MSAESEGEGHTGCGYTCSWEPTTEVNILGRSQAGQSF